MKNNFDTCMAQIWVHEGGYVNDPQDPGGETNLGISKRAYPKENIKTMTRARASAIYKRDYWDAVRGDELPSGLDYVAFDGAVNSGVSRGAKWVQHAIGASVDGRIGTAALESARKADVPKAINRACDARLAFMRNLSTWSRFGKGWQSRVDGVRRLALTMADKPKAPPERSGLFAAIIAALRVLFISIFHRTNR